MAMNAGLELSLFVTGLHVFEKPTSKGLVFRAGNGKGSIGSLIK